MLTSVKKFLFLNFKTIFKHSDVKLTSHLNIGCLLPKMLRFIFFFRVLKNWLMPFVEAQILIIQVKAPLNTHQYLDPDSS